MRVVEYRWPRIELAIVEDPSCVLIGRTRSALENSLIGRHLKLNTVYILSKVFQFFYLVRVIKKNLKIERIFRDQSS